MLTNIWTKLGHMSHTTNVQHIDNAGALGPCMCGRCMHQSARVRRDGRVAQTPSEFLLSQKTSMGGGGVGGWMVDLAMVRKGILYTEAVAPRPLIAEGRTETPAVLPFPPPGPY